MTLSYVYKITNKINNKVYIGKSDNPSKRCIRHFSTAKTGYNKNHKYQYIHRAINKHGKDNFVFEVIETCDSSEIALEREVYWIKELNANNSKFGYNLTNGGDGGCTPQTAAKISKTLKGRINTLNGLCKKLYKLFCLIPNYKKDIYKSKSKIDRRARARLIIKNYFENKEMPYDLKDPQKKLSDNLKQDVINIYNSGEVLVADLSEHFNVLESQIKYILSRYKNGIPTEEQKHINRSESHKGKKHSEEHKKKISQANMGRVILPESRQKISQANSGENNGMFGKTPSKESKQKMSEFQSSRERRPLTEEEKLHLSNNLKGKPQPPRIPIEIKNEVVQLYASGNYTKRQLAEKFGLKFNSVVKIIRTNNNSQ
jgi:group I intron endonuclease